MLQFSKKCQHCRKEPAVGSIRGPYGWLRICKKCKRNAGIQKPKNILKNPPKKEKGKEDDTN